MRTYLIFHLSKSIFLLDFSVWNKNNWYLIIFSIKTSRKLNKKFSYLIKDKGNSFTFLVFSILDLIEKIIGNRKFA